MADGSVPTESGPIHFGSITATQYLEWTGAVTHHVSGQFFVRTGPATSMPCAPVRTVSGCEVLRCNTTGVASPFTAVDAGTLTVSGSKASVVATSGPTLGYAAQGTGLLWDVGTAVSASVTGSALVPSFGTSANGPGQITVTSPVFPVAGIAGSLARAWPFQVTWAGESVGDVRVQLLAQQPLAPGNYVALTCAAPASASSLTVSTEALAELPVGWTTSLSVSLMAQQTVRSGDWQLWLALTGTARTPDNRAPAASVVLY